MTVHVLNVALGLGALVLWVGSFAWYFNTDVRRWLDRQYWWHRRRWPWRR